MTEYINITNTLEIFEEVKKKICIFKYKEKLCFILKIFIKYKYKRYINKSG